MNYQKLYNDLIDKAFEGFWGYTSVCLEQHHIIPVSLGGKDSQENWCYLPIRVHFILHAILVKQGYVDQVFAVELIARRMKRRLPKWIRKRLNIRQQQLFREANRERLLGSSL